MKVSKFIPKRRSLSPPKPPGTHTNDEVKKALHQRGLYRTIIVSLIVLLLLMALVTLTSTTQEIKDTASYAPKLFFLSTDGLAPSEVEYCMQNTQLPFTMLLTAHGGIYGQLWANYSSTKASLLVKLLTGSPLAENPTLEGAESFLRKLKKANYRPLIAAPAGYWSSNQVEDPTKCKRVGIFDSECTGLICPGLDKVSYCNAYQKYLLHEGRESIFLNEIVEAFREAVVKAADVVYIQLGRFASAEKGKNGPLNGENNTDKDLLELCADVNLLDAALGMLALTISDRTRAKDENWLIIWTGDGANLDHNAPLFMVAYSKGQVIQLNDFKSGFYTTDVYRTVLTWFGLHPTSNESNLIGICTNGTKAANCKN